MPAKGVAAPLSGDDHADCPSDRRFGVPAVKPAHAGLMQGQRPLTTLSGGSRGTQASAPPPSMAIHRVTTVLTLAYWDTGYYWKELERHRSGHSYPALTPVKDLSWPLHSRAEILKKRRVGPMRSHVCDLAASCRRTACNWRPLRRPCIWLVPERLVREAVPSVA